MSNEEKRLNKMAKDLEVLKESIEALIAPHFKEFLSSKEVAQLYPISASKARELAMDHKMPHHRHNEMRRVYFKRSELNVFFDNKKTKQLLNN